MKTNILLLLFLLSFVISIIGAYFCYEFLWYGGLFIILGTLVYDLMDQISKRN